MTKQSKIRRAAVGRSAGCESIMPIRDGSITPTCSECGCADKVTVSNLMQAWVCLRCRIWWRADKFGDLENGHNNRGAGQCTGGRFPVRPVLSISTATKSQLQPLVQGRLQEEVKSIEIAQYVCPYCLQADALFKVHDDRELIEGWGCHRCKSVQLRNAEYADVPPPAAAPVRTPTIP